MSGEDLQKAFLWASLAGAACTAAYIALEYQSEEASNTAVSELESHKDRFELQKDIISELTAELKTRFKSSTIPKD